MTALERYGRTQCSTINTGCVFQSVVHDTHGAFVYANYSITALFSWGMLVVSLHRKVL